MGNNIDLRFFGLSILEPYTNKSHIDFIGLPINTKKQSSLRFWGTSISDSNAGQIDIQILN